MGRHEARVRPGLTLDSGALVALDRGDRNVMILLKRAEQAGARISIPAGVVGQTWRNGRLQVRVARILGATGVEIVPLDDQAARAAGQLCGASNTSDVIDASVVLCARSRGSRVMTSDPEDMTHLDPSLELITV